VNGKAITRMMRYTDKDSPNLGEIITKRRDAEAARADFIASLGLAVKDEAQVLETVSARLDGKRTEIERIEDAQPSMTLLQAWSAFKAAPKGKTPRGRVIMPGVRTLDDYEGRWNAFCDWMERTYPKKGGDGDRIPWELRQITKEHAQRYIAEIEATRSGNTRNKTLTFLRLVFKVLSENARIKENPFDGMNAAPLAVSRKRPLTMAELGTISKSLEGQGEMEILFALGYYTGARLGDCALMRWDSIDMSGRKIRYTPHKTAKGNTEITVAIPPTLFNLLDKTPKSKRRGYVLPSIGEQYETRSGVAIVSRRVQKVFADADIDTEVKVKGYSRSVARVGFHSLRHSYITALLEGGVPMDVVRQQAGHTTIGMTAHYFHASDKSLKAIQDALPEIGRGTAPDDGADAAAARFEGVLAMLDAFTDEQLERLAAKAREIVDGRK